MSFYGYLKAELATGVFFSSGIFDANNIRNTTRTKRSPLLLLQPQICLLLCDCRSRPSVRNVIVMERCVFSS